MNRVEWLATGLLVPLLALGTSCAGAGDEPDAGCQGDGCNGGGADCELDPGIAFHFLNETLQFLSQDGHTCVYVHRRDDSQPGIIYKAVPFTLLEMRIGHDEELVTVDDPGNLTWTSTHHNWMDTGTALTSGVRYLLEMVVATEPRFTVTALDRGDGRVVWGPVLLLSFPPGP